MPVREGPAEPAPPAKDETVIPAEKARGGTIILRTRTQRAIFIGGLIAAGVLALLLRLFWH